MQVQKTETKFETRETHELLQLIAEIQSLIEEMFELEQDHRNLKKLYDQKMKTLFNLPNEKS